MKIHYEEKADLMTITFRENDRYGHDVTIEDGKAVVTFGPDGALTEIEIFQASKNGDMVLSYCNLPLNTEKVAKEEKVA